MHISPVANKNILRGFAGGTYESELSALVETVVDTVTAQVNIMAVDDNKLAFAVLIGRDLVDQPHIRLIKEYGKLMFKNNVNFKYNDCFSRDEILREELHCNEHLNQ